jgi:hypothetical protein
MRLTARVQIAQAIVGATILVVVSGGCGRSEPRAAVEGVVRLNGSPLDRCLVTFLPEGEASGGCCSAMTDENGFYRLRLADQREGATIGPHRVTIQDMTVSTGTRRRDHGEADRQADASESVLPVRASRIRKCYGVANDTPLRKEIKPGRQVIDLDLE